MANAAGRHTPNFITYACPLCGHRENQLAGAVVHHPCPRIPAGHRRSRLARLLPVEEQP